MRKPWIMRLISLCLLLLGLLVAVQPVLAADEPTPTPTPTITLPTIPVLGLSAKYATLEATSGGSYEFEIELHYYDPALSPAVNFTLTATGPKDWDVYITPSYPKDKKIKDVRLDPGMLAGETVLVTAAPPYWLQPEPGIYPIKLVVSSPALSSSIDLKAIVTAKYDFTMAPPQGGLYSTTATSGKDNSYAMVLTNYGSAAVEDISFSADKPDGWTVTFAQDKVASLKANETQNVDVIIKPASNAIAGDYMLTLHATGKQATASIMDVRVTVQTPAIWEWLGVAIIVLVVVGLTFVIMRFSRR